MTGEKKEKKGSSVSAIVSGYCYCQNTVRAGLRNSMVCLLGSLIWLSFMGVLSQKKTHRFEEKNQSSPIVGNYVPLVEDDYCHLQKA